LSPPNLTTPPPSTLCLQAEDDPAFKNDLAHVLVWFSDDLTNQQRLVTAFTLAKNLSKFQMEFLVHCLQQQDSDNGSPVNGSSRSNQSILSSPIRRPEGSLGVSNSWRGVPAPEPIRTIASWGEKGRQTREPSVGSSPEAVPPNSALFHADLAGWLRFHRLHKYLSVFQSLPDWRKALELDDIDLEGIGIAAVGARRKFLRLFELIRAETS
jgi:hypothetical protein